MNDIEVTILNWDKYQFRKQIKSPSWFRVENRLWCDQQFFYFTGEERWIWICLLSLASQKQSATLSISLEWFSQNSGVSVDSIKSSLQKLKDNKCLEYTLRGRNVHVPECVSTRQDITRHNKTRQDITKTFSIAVKQASPPMPMKESLENHFFYLSEQILKIYPDQEFVSREKEKMKLWLSTNEKKAPKSKSGWTRFVMGWLERGWERYRKSIGSQKSGFKGIEEILAEEEKDGYIDV